MKLIARCLTTALLLVSCSSFADDKPVSPNFIKPFIDNMVRKHHFEREYLEVLFSNITLNDVVTQKLSSPYEAKPWQDYRTHFLTDKRINGGVEYWRYHQKTLAKAEKQYGVPAHIIVALIGVESSYGAISGQFPTLETLTTLASNYPSRAPFFTKELENFLLLSREQQMNPLTIKGSYAGAMGMPQFMPSSYRHYAVNFSGNRNIDLIHNDADVIGSIGNYLAKNGWKKNELVAVPAEISNPELKKVQQNPLKPTATVAELAEQGVTWEGNLHGNQPAAFFNVTLNDQPQYWIGLHNFKVISTYNHNLQYVLAVHQLSQAIKEKREQRTQ